MPQRAYSVVQRLLMAGTWLNISLADDLAAILAREPADAVVIDCMLAGVLARSAEFGAPAAVLVPGLYHSVLPVRDAMLAAGLGLTGASIITALLLGLGTVAVAPLFTLHRLRRMDIPSTLRLVE